MWLQDAADFFKMLAGDNMWHANIYIYMVMCTMHFSHLAADTPQVQRPDSAPSLSCQSGHTCQLCTANWRHHRCHQLKKLQGRARTCTDCKRRESVLQHQRDLGLHAWHRLILATANRKLDNAQQATATARCEGPGLPVG